MAGQVELAEQYRVQQAALRAAVVQQVLSLWLRLFDPVRARETWSPLRTALLLLVRDRAQVSGLISVRYYMQARDLWAAQPVPVRPSEPARSRPALSQPHPPERPSVGGRQPVLGQPRPTPILEPAAQHPPLAARPTARAFTPDPVPAVADEAIMRDLDSTGLGAFLHSVKAGQEIEQAKQNAGVQLSGAASKMVVDAGRDTIQQAVRDDEDAIGWARVTDAKPCAFCAMLASRGPAYKSRKTASFQAHNHCACVAVPVFSEDEVWLQHGQDLAAQWQKATAGKTGKDAMIAWRRHWEGR